MFMQVEPIEFALFRHTQQSDGVDQIHQPKGHSECAHGDRQTADCLCNQDLGSPSIKQASQGSGVVSSHRSGGSILAAGKQPEGDCSPDAAHAVHGNGADRIINPQPFQQFDAQNYDDPGYASKKYGSGGTDPITGASDGDKP